MDTLCHDHVLLLTDGVTLKAGFHHRDEINSQTADFLSLIIPNSFARSVLDTKTTMESMISRINFHEHSVIFDLTGQLRKHLHHVVSEDIIVDTLHVSSLRLITSPKIDSVGRFVSLGTPQLQQLLQKHDVSHPLLIDDTAMSGRTVLDVVKLIGLKPEHTTLGAFVVNNGNFGENKPGARQLLESRGIRVVSGVDIKTPRDDAFHLEDFLSVREKETLRSIIVLQKIREESHTASPDSAKSSNDSIAELLKDIAIQTMPHALSQKEIISFVAEGKVIGFNGMPKDGIASPNPPAFLLRSFSLRTRADLLDQNSDTILSVIGDIDHIRRETKESQELFDTSIHMSEQQFHRGGERLW